MSGILKTLVADRKSRGLDCSVVIMDHGDVVEKLTSGSELGSKGSGGEMSSRKGDG